MELICIDESGSLGNTNLKDFPYFVICLVRIKNRKQIKKSFKRFVSSHLAGLKLLDKDYKMFAEGSFKELKGCCLDPKTKIELANYLSKKDGFEFYLIEVKNSACDQGFFDNTNRSFNFLVEQCLDYLFRHSFLPKGEEFVLNVDNRNVKNDAKLSFEDYLDTSLRIEKNFFTKITVNYFDSSKNVLVQLADFFANLGYSSLMTKNYEKLIESLKESGHLKYIYKFPLHCS